MSLYFIALIPPENIKEEIKAFKEEVKDKYGVKHALKLPAHITLQRPFKMPDNLEQELKNVLTRFSGAQQKFEIESSGFGRFDQRAIFAEIKNKEPVIELFKNLQKILPPFVNVKDKQDNIHPHLTVATRDLSRQLFPAVWKDFKDREYNSTFIINGLFLLKHNGKLWEIISENNFEA